MKKLSRIFALTLLLAVVLSCFGIFSTFAAEATEAAQTYGETIYDMDSKSSISIKNQATLSDGTKVPQAVKSTYNGQKVFTIDWKNTPVGTDPATSGDYFDTLSNSWTNFVIRDDAGYGTRAGTDKNTDYIVLDFDIATESEFVDDVYINFRVLMSGATAYNKNTTGGDAYTPSFRRDSDGKIYVCNTNGSNIVRPLFESDNKWTNVTLIWDCTGDKVYCYVYFDGYYSGRINGFTDSAAVVYFARFQTNAQKNISNYGATTSFANLTFKKFAAGYEGPMTQGNLGDDGTTLADYADLRYCLEDTPADPDGWVTKLADIQRGDQTIECFDEDDLSGNLENGDVITLYKKVPHGHVVVKEGVSVTWKDANNVTLGEENALVPAPAIVTVKADSDWAVVNATTAAIVAEGKASDIYSERVDLNGDGEYTVLYADENGNYSLTEDETFNTKVTTETSGRKIVDPLTGALVGTGSQKVHLFADVTVRAPGTSGVGSSTTSSLNPSTADIVFDLNGNTLTVDPFRNHYFQINGALSARVFFENGTVNHSGNNNVIMLNSVTSAMVTYEDVTLNMLYGTWTDHRDGCVYYKNCVINANKYFLLRSSYNDASCLYMDGCTVNGSVARELFSVDNVKANQGSSENYLFLKNSTFVVNATDTDDKGGATFISLQPTIGKDGGEYNDVNKAVIDIVGCSIELNANDGSEVFIRSEILGTDADKVVSVYDYVNIENTSIDAEYFIHNTVTNGSTNDYVCEQNVTVKNSEIATGVLTSYNASARLVELNIHLADGVKLGTDEYTISVDYAPEVTFDSEASKIVYSSLDADCDFVVSQSYAPYTYQLGTQDAVEFLWNVPAEGTDEVDINKVVTLASEAGVYKYSWAQDGNAFSTVLDKDFTLSAQANLTLWSDLYFNLYVPKALADAYAEYISIVDADGALVEGVYVESLNAYKYQIKSLAPTDAENEVIFVKTAINGAYGDTYNASKGFTVVEYAENVLSNDKTEDDAVIYALLNYLNAMYVLNNGAVDADIDALLPDDYTAATISGEAKLGTLADTTIAINCGTTLNWVITGAANASYEVEYYLAGQLVERTVTADANGVAYINVSTMDMLSSITVNGAEINIQGYYGKLVEMGADANVIAAVEAIYDLATAAVAYNA